MEEQTIDQSSFESRVEYGGFWIRFVAAIIDGVLLTVINLVITLIFGDGSIIGALLSLLLDWGYFAGMESSFNQATLGKKAMGLRVTDLNGERISFMNATGRYFSKILSALILLIGYIMAGFDSKKRALHDMIAGTYVIKSN